MSAIALTEPQGATDLIGNSSFDVDVLTGVDTLDAFQSEWSALQRLSGPSAVFQSHAQIRSWAHHFVPPRQSRIRLHVAVARQRGRAVLILPLVISGPPFLRIAHMAGDPVAQYSEILADPAVNMGDAFEAALLTVEAAGADAIVLRRVREDALLLRLAGPLLRPATSPQVAPFADLSGVPDYGALLKGLSRSLRHELTRRRRKLEGGGDARFELVHGGPQARQMVSDALDLKRVWLVHRGAMSSAFVDPTTRACLLDLAEDAATGSTVARLTIDGVTAAIRFGFEYQDTHFAYLSAYDESFAEFSPGTMLMSFVLTGFRERALTGLDMLPPAGRHKREWCRSEMRVADYTLPLTAAGRAYAEIYQEHVRPGLRWTWDHMPASLRSLLALLLVRL